MKALKSFGFLGGSNATGNAARRRARRRAVPQPRGAAQAARRARRRDAAPARSPQAAGSGHRPRAGNVRVAREAARSRPTPAYLPWFSITCAPCGPTGARSSACWCRISPPSRKSASARPGRSKAIASSSSNARRPSSSCARRSRSWSRRASSWWRSMRGSRKLDKWWHRWQRPKLAAQRPALQAAVDAAEATLHRRARALRTDRESRRR